MKNWYRPKILESVKKKNIKRQNSFLRLYKGAGSNFREKITGNINPVKGLKVAPVNAIAAFMFGTAIENR
jgi:hypothetical protein